MCTLHVVSALLYSGQYPQITTIMHGQWVIRLARGVMWSVVFALCVCVFYRKRKSIDSEEAARQQHLDQQEMRDLDSPLPVEVNNPLAARNSVPHEGKEDVFVEYGLDQRRSWRDSGLASPEKDEQQTTGERGDLPPPPTDFELAGNALPVSESLPSLNALGGLPPPPPDYRREMSVESDLPPPPSPVKEPLSDPVIVPASPPPPPPLPSSGPPAPAPPPPSGGIPPPPPLPVAGSMPTYKQQRSLSSSSGTNDSGRFSVRSLEGGSGSGSRASRISRNSMPSITPGDLKGVLKKGKQRPPIPKPMLEDNVVTRPKLRSVPRPSSMQLDIEKDKMQQTEAGTPKSDTLRSTSSAVSISSEKSGKVPPPTLPKHGSVKSRKSVMTLQSDAGTPTSAGGDDSLSRRHSAQFVGVMRSSFSTDVEGAAPSPINVSMSATSLSSNPTSSNGTLGDKSVVSSGAGSEQLSPHNVRESYTPASPYTSNTLPTPSKPAVDVGDHAETLDRSQRSKAADERKVSKSTSMPEDLKTMDGIDNLTQAFDQDVSAAIEV